MQFLEFIQNHLFLNALFLSLVLLLLWDIRQGMAEAATLLSPLDLTRLINQEDVLLVDLRSSQDYASGHIIGARNIPAGELDTQLSTLQKHKADTVILYCNNGGESNRQGKALRVQGFTALHTLKGGVQEWRHAEMPLTRADQPAQKKGK